MANVQDVFLRAGINAVGFSRENRSRGIRDHAQGPLFALAYVLWLLLGRSLSGNVAPKVAAKWRWSIASGIGENMQQGAKPLKPCRAWARVPLTN
jgi:hypothetical protein